MRTSGKTIAALLVTGLLMAGLAGLGGVLAQGTFSATIVGVSIYDRVSSGAGTSGNLNRVRFVNASGSSIGSVYPAGSYPANSEKSWNYSVALDVHPDPDPSYAALGVTFVKHIYVADTANHRIRRFRLEKKSTSPSYDLAGSPTASQYLVEWGSHGDALGTTMASTRLAYPGGIAVHPVTHDVYVADTMNSRILVFEFDTDPQVATPRIIELEAAVWNGSTWLIQQTNPAGSHLIGSHGDFRNPLYPPANTLGAQSNITDDGGAGVGVAELGQGSFYYPHGLAIDVDPGVDAVDPTDDVTYLYVADTWNHRIQVFRDQNVGHASHRFRFHRMWGGYGTTGQDRFRYPRSVAVSRIGTNVRVFVADTRNTRVQMFNVDLSGNVAYHGSFGSSSNLVNPVDIATDSSGNVYVADPQNDQITGNRSSRIRKYDNDGAFVGNIAGTALSTSAYLPYGLDVADVTQY